MRRLNRRERFGLELARTLRALRPGMFLLLVVMAVASMPRIPLLLGFVAAGTTRLDSTGLLKLDNTGRRGLFNGTTDKCCCPCAACVGCVEGPCSVTIIITGVSICSGCLSPSCGTARWQMSGGVNGTYDVSRTGPGACQFSTTVNCGYSYWSSGSACSGAPSDSTSTLPMNLVRTSSTNWNLEVNGIYPDPFSSNVTVPSGDCTTSLTMPNLWSGCTFIPFPTCSQNAGSGGSAAVTFHYA